MIFYTPTNALEIGRVRFGISINKSNALVERLKRGMFCCLGRLIERVGKTIITPFSVVI